MSCGSGVSGGSGEYVGGSVAVVASSSRSNSRSSRSRYSSRYQTGTRFQPVLPTHAGTIVASQRGTAQPSHSHMPRIHRGIQGHRSALVVGWVNKNGTLFFILFIAWERWEELVSRLGNLSWELGGLGSSFPDHALGPNWDSGIGTHHMLTAPFGRPIGEGTKPLLRGLPSTKLLLKQGALHDRPGAAGAAPPGCVSTRRRALRRGPSTHGQIPTK